MLGLMHPLHMRAQKAKNLLDRALAEQQEQDDAEESYE